MRGVELLKKKDPTKAGIALCSQMLTDVSSMLWLSMNNFKFQYRESDIMSEKIEQSSYFRDSVSSQNREGRQSLGELDSFPHKPALKIVLNGKINR